MAQTREKPTFIVRAPDPNNRGRWLTLGAAWQKTLDDGQTAYGQAQHGAGRRRMGRGANAPAAARQSRRIGDGTMTPEPQKCGSLL